MTLQLESLCGSSTPTRSKYPTGDFDYALADDVLSWLDSIGMTLFDWQRGVLRNALAVDERGKWAAYDVGLIVPRQNGKNEILVALELASVQVLRKRLVVHSAHEASTAAKQMARFSELTDVDSASYLPEVAKMLPATKNRGFHTANGKEHLTFRNGALIEFKTRTRTGTRGFSSDLVVLDEAFELSPKAYGSLMYTMRARKNPQVWKTSSAPHAHSSILHADRRRAIEADPEDSRFLYMEWGNDEGCEPSDPASWARSNPSLGMDAPGFALEVQTFRNEWAAAKGDPETVAEFVREVCGVPEEPISEGTAIIPIATWDALAAEKSEIVQGETFALDVSIDRQWSSIAVAGRCADGVVQLEVIERKPGTDWVVADLIERKAAIKSVRIEKGGPAGSLITLLVEAGIEVTEVSTAELARATSQFIDAAKSGGLRHLGSPSLRNAVAVAILRHTGDADLWGRRGSKGDISPLVACTLALGGVPEVVVKQPMYFDIS